MPQHVQAGQLPRQARIAAVGGYRPRRVVGNEEICHHVDSTDQWIRRRTGIETRHFAEPDETLEAMAAAAADKALAEAGVDPSQVGVVIAATMSYLYQAPPLAARAGALLDGFRGAAFDVSGACAGFCHALELARVLVSSGSADHVVVVGAERMSDIVDPTDRSTAFLFGDGAGAVVVAPSRETRIFPPEWGSDPSGADAIAQPDPWDCGPARPEAANRYLGMHGQEVFRWVTDSVPAVAEGALARAGMSVQDLAAFVPHQANLRITESLVRALGLPPEVRVARDVVRAGNTSAASIPLALESLLAQGEMSGRPALLLGFGSGLGHCAQTVLLP
ncbi:MULTISPECIES: beta-ketoacyl-ACP synthase 3 [unclassified Streptomyces]|uniref:beta-ketoacyl-ACP synthase 3 n=1 Tax=unclassified Streptomyces TaxID=2593676 RepID=UPI000CD4E2A3|nr:beta-ketoacyl-ACP synthase 3 [Streptomyces sp. SM10]